MRKHRTKKAATNCWSVRLYREGTSDQRVHLQLTFPTEDGKKARILSLVNALARPGEFLVDLDAYLPAFPKTVKGAKGRIRFLRHLVDEAMQKEIDQLPVRTGFMDLRHFATHSELLRADRSPQPLPRPFGTPGIVDRVGSRDGYERAVLNYAERSSYLVMAIGVALAAPIPSYFRMHGPRPGAAAIVSETAVFNLSGESSSGKSTAGNVSLSVSSSPERAGTFDFTQRGLSEFVANSNDLVAVIDDVEHAKISEQQLFTNILTVCQKIPGGASKMISAQSSYENLEWSTFAISSSPASIF
jgi:hypothetical protein